MEYKWAALLRLEGSCEKHDRPDLLPTVTQSKGPWCARLCALSSPFRRRRPDYFDPMSTLATWLKFVGISMRAAAEALTPIA